MKGQKKMEEEGGRPPERPVLVLTVSQLKYMLIGAILALLFNNLMISSTSFHVPQNCAASDIIPADFFSSSDSRLSKVTALEKASALESQSEKVVVGSPSASSLDDGPKLLRNSRVLIGIFTMDSDFDASHRKWHRNLFNNVWNDERVCTLGHFRASNNTSFRQKCEVIYTFVAGANEDPNAPTERLRATDTATTPIELPRGYKRPSKPEINNPDVTHLNIRENMEDGKSQTWLYFASKMATQFVETPTPIDYVMKLDSDSILKLHEFLEFKDSRLPPAPYNKNIFLGALRDKLQWYVSGDKKRHDAEDRPRYESHWGREHENVHIYLAGQCYLMSAGLAAFVAEEAPLSKIRVAPGGYVEGVEDHDISAMVYHSPSPISWMTIGKSQRFWEHPVKGLPRYRKIVEREQARVNRKPFEGEELKFYAAA